MAQALQATAGPGTPGVSSVIGSPIVVLPLLLAFTIAPLWSLRDSKGFRRRSIAQRALWRRIAYRLTALPGLLLAAALGLVVVVLGGILLGVAWLIGVMNRRDAEDDDDVDDGGDPSLGDDSSLGADRGRR